LPIAARAALKLLLLHRAMELELFFEIRVERANADHCPQTSQQVHRPPHR